MGNPSNSFPETTESNYFYDEMNRLTRVEPSNGTVIVYEFDSAGNRLLKQSGFLGDIDEDGTVSLADAILVLKISSGADVSAHSISTITEVNADNKIGFAEALFILQKMAGNR
jgi:hypothetical protein